MLLKKPPFEYSSNLIGSEIIFRCLKQQKKFHDAGEYGMTWDQNDLNAQIAAKFQSEIMRTEFSISIGGKGCVNDPPCPWPKEGDADEDQLSVEDLMPIIVSEDGVNTFRYRVAECRYPRPNTFEIGDDIGEYVDAQSKLDPSVRNDFNCFEFNLLRKPVPKAIFVIEQIQQGGVVNTFTYIFTFV